MRKCTICGTKLLPNETICPNCGNQYKTSQKEKKKLVKSIDWKFVFRALGRVLLAFIIVYDVYSWVSRPQTTPQDYFENQYGENYDLIEYKDYDSFKKDYPELSEQIQPYYQLVKERHTYEENPEIVFYYDVTNLSGNKDVTAATAWMAMFTVIQDNDPNVVNTLESGWYSDPDITVDGFATMKKDGTVSYYASYELDDLTTPVTLEATRGIGGEELGTQTFEIEGK